MGYQSQLTQLLKFMAEYMANRHVPPTRKAMAEAMSISHSTLYAWLKELQGQGKIDRVGDYWVVCGFEYVDKRQWRVTTK